MAAINFDVLASGQVANSQTTVFTAATPTWVREVSFMPSADGEVVTLWVLPSGGTARRIGHWELDTSEKGSYDTPISLGVGDALQASTTTAATVDYAVLGGARAP